MRPADACRALADVDAEPCFLEAEANHGFADVVVIMAWQTDRDRRSQHERAIEVDEVVTRRDLRVLKAAMPALTRIHGQIREKGRRARVVRFAVVLRQDVGDPKRYREPIRDPVVHVDVDSNVCRPAALNARAVIQKPPVMVDGLNDERDFADMSGRDPGLGRGHPRAGRQREECDRSGDQAARHVSARPSWPRLWPPPRAGPSHRLSCR
jgi:hypothetical protein